MTLIKTKLVGVTKRNEDGSKRQELLVCLADGEEVFLDRERNNPYDSNAIAVFDRRWDQLGYLSRDLASDLAPLMDAGHAYRAHVLGVSGGGEKSYGCNIQIEDATGGNTEGIYPSSDGNAAGNMGGFLLGEEHCSSGEFQDSMNVCLGVAACGLITLLFLVWRNW